MTATYRKYAAFSLIIWSIVVLVYLLGPGGILQLKLRGSDDYMRFVQVFNWLDGQSWFDLSEPRINPPDGIFHHWTRLADIPLAAVISVVEPWAGRSNAVITAAIFVPSLLFYLILLAFGWLAHPMIGRSQMPLVIFMGILSVLVVLQFKPGRVDHHQWILLTTAISLGALARILIRPDAARPPLIAAAAFALGLWVVGAIIPWLIAFNISLLIHWARIGDNSVRAGALFSAALLAMSTLILMASKPASAWMIVASDSFSILSVGITGLVFLFWTGLWLGRDRLRSAPTRLAAAAGLGAVLAGGVVFVFPNYLVSPYAKVDPYLMKIWISNIGEIQSILTILFSQPHAFAGWVGAPLVALVVSFVCAFRVSGRRRSLWIMFFIFLAMGVALSLWQKRFISATHLISIVPVTWLLSTQIRRLEKAPLSAMGFFAGKYILVILFGMGFWLFGIFAPEQPDRPNCDIRKVAAALPKQATSPPTLIAAPIDDNAEILFRTPHAVLGAPYHRNNEGNLDLLAILQATSVDAAHAVVDRRGVDYIMICPSAGSRHIYRGKGSPSFYDRLAIGESPPWLAPMDLASKSDLRIFKVVAP